MRREGEARESEPKRGLARAGVPGRHRDPAEQQSPRISLGDKRSRLGVPEGNSRSDRLSRHEEAMRRAWQLRERLREVEVRLPRWPRIAELGFLGQNQLGNHSMIIWNSRWPAN